MLVETCDQVLCVLRVASVDERRGKELSYVAAERGAMQQSPRGAGEVPKMATTVVPAL